MNKFKKLLIVFFTVTFATQVFSKDIPGSFADLAERLMPSVVNISTTTTVVTNTNPFPGFYRLYQGWMFQRYQAARECNDSCATNICVYVCMSVFMYVHMAVSMYS